MCDLNCHELKDKHTKPYGVDNPPKRLPINKRFSPECVICEIIERQRCEAMMRTGKRLSADTEGCEKAHEAFFFKKSLVFVDLNLQLQRYLLLEGIVRIV